MWTGIYMAAQQKDTRYIGWFVGGVFVLASAAKVYSAFATPAWYATFASTTTYLTSLPAVGLSLLSAVPLAYVGFGLALLTIVAGVVYAFIQLEKRMSEQVHKLEKRMDKRVNDLKAEFEQEKGRIETKHKKDIDEIKKELKAVKKRSLEQNMKLQQLSKSISYILEDLKYCENELNRLHQLRNQDHVSFDKDVQAMYQAISDLEEQYKEINNAVLKVRMDVLDTKVEVSELSDTQEPKESNSSLVIVTQQNRVEKLEHQLQRMQEREHITLSVIEKLMNNMKSGLGRVDDMQQGVMLIAARMRQFQVLGQELCAQLPVWLNARGPRIEEVVDPTGYVQGRALITYRNHQNRPADDSVAVVELIKQLTGSTYIGDIVNGSDSTLQK